MREYWFFVFFTLGFIGFVPEHGAGLDTAYIAADTPYCLQFTWLGPTYDTYNNEVNITCSDFSGTPCIEPLIITNDGSEPNITYMWDNYNHTVIGCPLRSGFSCIKYTYTYDNAVMNASYFCGKMIADTTDPLQTGCYTQDTGGYTIEACACRTNAGESPCSSSTTNVAFVGTQLMLLLIVYLRYISLA